VYFIDVQIFNFVWLVEQVRQVGQVKGEWQ